MMEENSNIGRRKVLKLTSGVLGSGIMAGTASARGNKRKTKNAADSELVSKFEKLTDSITVVNGKAKVEPSVRSEGKGKVEVSANGKSLKFTAKEIVKQINEGVKNGYWKIKESGGELDLDLTEEGLSQFLKDGDKDIGSQSHCNGRNGIDGDTIYLDDNSVDEINWGSALSAGIFTIAAAIAAVLSGVGLIAIVLTAAAVLATVASSYIFKINEGCGIKIDTSNDTVSGQHCDC